MHVPPEPLYSLVVHTAASYHAAPVSTSTFQSYAEQLIYSHCLRQIEHVMATSAFQPLAKTGI